MPRARDGTNKKALARIQRLCCLGIGSEMLMPDLIREVMGLIGSPGGVFRWAGPDLEITNTYITVSAALLELHYKEFLEKPGETELMRTFRQNMLSPTPIPVMQFWRHSIMVDRHTFVASDYYNLLWRPSAVDELVMLRVREPGRNHGGLYVWRGPDDVPFEPGEIRMLGSIGGFIAHAMTRATMAEDAFVDGDDRALFLADLDGAVRHAGGQARHLLMMALLPRWSPNARWRSLHQPTPEIARLCGSLATTANGGIGQPPPVLRLRNSWGEFVLRAYWFGATDGTEHTSRIGITIERRVPRALAVLRRVEDLPLTGREKQLCLLLAHNLTGQDLGDALGVTTSTVIAHQRGIYAKLGVHGRAGLLELLRPA